jgi:hypothetical protein
VKRQTWVSMCDEDTWLMHTIVVSLDCHHGYNLLLANRPTCHGCRMLLRMSVNVSNSCMTRNMSTGLPGPNVS